MVAVAAVIGVAGGLGAVGFRRLIGAVQVGAWGELPYGLDRVRAHPWWWIVLIPALGGLLVGPLVHFLAREAKGHGVPEVMEAVALRFGVIRPRLVVVKSLASAITIGTGGSVGREGPIVQIGSALASTVGQVLRVSPAQLRTLVGCGAAAGIAATFNAPIAGSLFALEIILGDFAVAQFSPIVISSVMATVVSRYFLGDFPAFQVPPHELASAWELGVYAILGLVAGGVALAFIGLLYWMEDRWEAIPLPPWLLPAAGGLCVGAIALAFPHVLGVGYEATSDALRGSIPLLLLAALIPAKLLATSITLGSGGSGGIFAPSLFLGAMVGGLVGSVAHALLPGVTAGTGAYALVGMGAVVAGATHAPLTAILIIFELTSDYKLILPLMASCIIATLLTTRVRRESIYTKKLLRRGVDISRGRELNVLRALRVRDVMSGELVTVREGEPVGRLLQRLGERPYETLYVLDEDGRLAGTIGLGDLSGVVRGGEPVLDVLVARDLATETPAVHPDDSLDTVVHLFAGRRVDELPAVEALDRRLVGVVTRRHLLDAYDREMMRQEMAASLRGSLRATPSGEVSLGDDYRMAEMDAPTRCAGRTIGELGIRSRYGVQVLLIRRAPEREAVRLEVVPGPETVVRPGDRLVLVGRAHDLARFRAL
jgi:CIC family chloride channel protein